MCKNICWTMRSRCDIIAFSLFILLALFSGPATACQVSDDPPNIIVILVDDVSACEFSCYGGPIKTPNIEKLADRGIRFENAFGTPMCVPSRAMLLTGLHPDKTGVFHNSLQPRQIDNDSRSNWGKAFDLFPEVFQRNGYRTLVAGNWQMAGKYPTLGTEFGFDEYCLHHEWVRPDGWNQPLPRETRYDAHVGDQRDLFPGRTSGYWHPSVSVNGFLVDTSEKDFGPDIYNDYVLQFMERNRERPFMIYYPMMLAHTVTDFHSKERNNPDRRFGQLLPRCPKIVDGKPTDELEPDSVRGNVRYVDYLVRRISKKLRDLRLTDRTLILFTSDNGTIGKGKGQPDPRGAHIPFIASYPSKIPSGRVSDELVSLLDVHTTLTSFAGLETSKSSLTDGLDLSGLMAGDESRLERDSVYSFLGEETWVRNKKYLLTSAGDFYKVGKAIDNDPRKMKKVELRRASSRDVSNFKLLKMQIEDFPGFQDFDSVAYARYRKAKSNLRRRYAQTPTEDKRKFVQVENPTSRQ